MNCCVIGGSGHIGKNLVHMLLEDGHEVTIITSGRRPIPETDEWRKVKRVRHNYQRNDPQWPNVLRDVNAEVVIDIPGTDVPATYGAVKGSANQLVACGSIWMFGEPRVVPTPEETQTECAFEGYAVRYRELLETRDAAQRDGFLFAAVMPPNIAGAGQIPLDCLGGRSIEVHKAHQRGEPVALPEPGQTLIGPCGAEDVAQGFFLAVKHPEAAAGEIFNVGTAYALTALQFVEAYASIYGKPIPINWVSWQEYSTVVSPSLGANFHFKAHMCPDISKIRSKLGYVPKYTSEQSLERGVAWMRQQGMI